MLQKSQKSLMSLPESGIPETTMLSFLFSTSIISVVAWHNWGAESHSDSFCVTNYRTGPIGAIGPTGAIPVPYRRYRCYTRALLALSALYQCPIGAIGAIPEPYSADRA